MRHTRKSIRQITLQVINIFQPEVLCLGGGISRRPPVS